LREDCRQVLEQIELYLDGELEPGVHVQIAAHLETCDPCLGHSDFQRHLKELLRARCGCDEVPVHVLERIRSIFADPAS
jgi:mycothiol system anti-sigma-R factor